MPDTALRAGGAALTIAYAVLIGWLATSQPQSLAEVTGGLAATFGAYEVDAVSFDEGLRLFRQDQFEAARTAWSRADPAGRDPRTQFYVAYSYYRQGWGRVSHDDALCAAGLEALSRAVSAAAEISCMCASKCAFDTRPRRENRACASVARNVEMKPTL